MIVTGSDLNESKKAIELAKAHRSSSPHSFPPFHRPKDQKELLANICSTYSRNNLHNRWRAPLLLPTIHQGSLKWRHLPHPTQSPRPCSQRVRPLRRPRRNRPRLRPSRTLSERYTARVLCQTTGRCGTGGVTAILAFSRRACRFCSVVEGEGTRVGEKGSGAQLYGNERGDVGPCGDGLGYWG